MSPNPVRERNDPAQYDDLVEEWWDPGGKFAMLHWIAEARARLVPPARRPGAVLVDVGCGAGLLAPHVATLGYDHVGVDVTGSALRLARDHGVVAVQGDAAALPIGAARADVVCAGEILEHVADVPAVIAEICRVLRPGGTLVLDTIADTALARLLVVTVAERFPGSVPVGLHDPALFVNRDEVRRCCRQAGVEVRISGLRPAAGDAIAWILARRRPVRMVATSSTAVLWQATGVRVGP